MIDAVVIPFPRAALRHSGPERLRRALEDLQSALSEQAKAVGDWRFAMAELGVGVTGLGHALGAYHDSLATVDAQLANLTGEAGRLHEWADEVMVGNGS